MSGGTFAKCPACGKLHIYGATCNCGQRTDMPVQSHRNGPLADKQTTSGPDTHRDLWRVSWPSGTGTLWAHHETEDEALADAERIVAGGTKTVTVYRIDEHEGNAA